jgi:hypothetical protein
VWRARSDCATRQHSGNDLRRKCNMGEVPESGQALATTMENFVIRRVIRVVARREASLRDPDESSAEERRVVDGHDGCHCSRGEG